MLSNLRPRSAYDVMAVLALFVALSTGGAYASHELIFSSDIVDGEVRTPDVANAAVTTNKLAQGAVTSGKVKNENLTGVDVLDGSLTGLDMSDDSLHGADIEESTLGQVPVAALGGVGRSNGGNGPACDPDTEAFVDCGFVRLDIPAQNRAGGTRVLVIGAITGVNEPGGASDGTGFCRLHWNPPAAPGNPLVGSTIEFDTSDEDRGDETEMGAMTAVTPLLGPGLVDFGIECREDLGGIHFHKAKIAAVALSPN